MIYFTQNLPIINTPIITSNKHAHIKFIKHKNAFKFHSLWYFKCNPNHKKSITYNRKKSSFKCQAIAAPDNKQLTENNYNFKLESNKKIISKKREDIKSILIIGAGPIIIGQACEFDYSGTQACKALRSEGYKVILLNSNPATIMTDPGTADRSYIGPMTVEVVEDIIKKEKPDALLPTMGGQTGLNLAKLLSENGILEKY